jgi:hypothetical protein
VFRLKKIWPGAQTGNDKVSDITSEEWAGGGVKRSAGITITAVLAFTGSALAVFAAALMALTFTVAIPNGKLPHGFGYIAIFSVLVMVLMAAWGIVSGVGLLKLREWSRISVLVFSALLLMAAFPGCLMCLFAKFPVPANSPDVELAQRTIWITRMFVAAMYAFLAALAVWWLYYFNLGSVKGQFAARHDASSGLDLESSTRIGPYSGGRPLSITIIAGLLMLGALSLPLFLVFHFPMMFLGFFFTGSAAALIILTYAMVQAALAYGLWELKPWGRNLSIYYFNFAIFNAVISAILPGAEARYEQMIAAIQSTMNLPAAPAQPHFPLWIALFFSLPFIGIQLWFLIASKPAFESPNSSVAR